MTAYKNRGFLAFLLSWALEVMIYAPLTACQSGGDQPVVMVASSLSFAINEWARAQGARWQGAGSQRIRQWLEAGAQPNFAIFAGSGSLERLKAQGLISWELELGCTTLSLAQRRSAHSRSEVSSEAELSVGAWRAWGEGLSPALRMGATAESVPLGQYSGTLLRQSAERFGVAWRARLEARVVTRALSAGASASLLELKEVDAVILYQTMAHGRPELSFTPLPSALSPEPRYLAVGLKRGGLKVAQALKAWLGERPEYGLRPCATPRVRAPRGINP